MPPAVLDRSFIQDLFQQTAEVDHYLIEHPKTGLLMVLVPAGKFLTGDGTPFEVDLPAYYMAVHPVTNAQYAHFVEETGHRKPLPLQAGWGSPVCSRDTFPPEKANHPVVYVSWEDATAYCSWAGLRLPTELEWVKAAYGLDGRAYPWGKSWQPNRCRNYRNHDRAGSAGVWCYGQGGSPFGGLQFSGNVWEWCADLYDANAYARYRQGSLAVSSRVMRGGSWASGRPSPLVGNPRGLNARDFEKMKWEDEFRDFRASCRGRREPGESDNSCGFRCVIEVGASS
jgi:sulfatase modifying factor 1